jgi:hypothetical protein
VSIVEPFERLPGAVTCDVAHELGGADEDCPGRLVGRLLFELDQQTFQAAEPVVAVVDRPRVLLRGGGVGVGRVACGVRS